MNKPIARSSIRIFRQIAQPLRGRPGRWLSWGLVAGMSIVLLMQISALTTRNYAVYDLEAQRSHLLRERHDLVLQLSTVQPLADLATTATAVGLQPAGAEQWTTIEIATPEGHP